MSDLLPAVRAPQSLPAPDFAETLGGSRARFRRFVHGRDQRELTVEESAPVKPPLRYGAPFPFVIAVIPAYNEQDSVLKAVESLRRQTRRPDEIIVLADNCTDGTVAIARAVGVTVVETAGNGDGKAGALNWFLAQTMPLLDDEDSILVMDADTVLSERFIESTVTTLFGPSRRRIAGVGGVFLADEAPWNLVRQLQENEYVRYARRLSRRRGRALVLTGTGTVFKIGFMREVVQARRAGRLPDLGQAGGVYDISALTEDNELTICAKELGYRVVSPKDCTVQTAMMPSLASLYRQRIRWQRGALENLIAHGINRHTAPYALRQVLTYINEFFLPFYLYTLTVALITRSSINFLQPLWIAVAVLYVVEQTFSVRRGGWRAIAVSIAALPELFYYVFLHFVYVTCLNGALFGTDEKWGRMRHLDAAEFDKRGRPIDPAARPPTSPLRGTHADRRRAQGLLLAVCVIVMEWEIGVVAVLVPWESLQTAWNLIAVYVLTGSVATIGRLIPVTTF